MGRYGGMVEDIVALVKHLKASGELERILAACDQPTETWRDWTAECISVDVSDEGLPHKQYIEDKDFVVARVESGYRLRKVPVYSGSKGVLSMGDKWAFIIEKREP
jgi:hypothetical protein